MEPHHEMRAPFHPDPVQLYPVFVRLVSAVFGSVCVILRSVVASTLYGRVRSSSHACSEHGPAPAHATPPARHFSALSVSHSNAPAGPRPMSTSMSGEGARAGPHQRVPCALAAGCRADLSCQYAVGPQPAGRGYCDDCVRRRRHAVLTTVPPYHRFAQSICVCMDVHRVGNGAAEVLPLRLRVAGLWTHSAQLLHPGSITQRLHLRACGLELWTITTI